MEKSWTTRISTLLILTSTGWDGFFQFVVTIFKLTLIGESIRYKSAEMLLVYIWESGFKHYYLRITCKASSKPGPVGENITHTNSSLLTVNLSRTGDVIGSWSSIMVRPSTRYVFRPQSEDPFNVVPKTKGSKRPDKSYNERPDNSNIFLENKLHRCVGLSQNLKFIFQPFQHCNAQNWSR